MNILQMFLFTLAAKITKFPLKPMFLMKAIGVNASQNKTFVDKSAAPIALTTYGNTCQGAVSPHNPNAWSVYLPALTDTVTSAAIPAIGTQPYTVEFSLFQNATPAATANMLSTPASFLIAYKDAATWGKTTTGSWTGAITSTSLPIIGQWNHIAYVREGTGTNQSHLYLNGELVATGTDATSYGATTVKYGGGLANVNYSNLRVVIGTAVYTAAFLMPMVDLFPVANTVLLAAQSNRFKDNGPNNYAFTLAGYPSPVPISPYSPLGWTVALYGAGDCVSLASNAAFAFGSGDFSIEATIYCTGFANSNPIFTTDGTNSSGLQVYVNLAGTPAMYCNGVWYYGIVGSVKVNTWTHIAVTRINGQLQIYTNGEGIGLQAYTGTNTSTRPRIGINPDAAYEVFIGYISNLRVLKGASAYSADFTAPEKPLAAITNTVLLTLQNNVLQDNSVNALALTAVGTAAMQRKGKNLNSESYSPALHGGSAYFDGTLDYIYAAQGNANLVFGTGSFTIEFWVNMSALPAGTMRHIIGRTQVAYGGDWVVYIDANMRPMLYVTLATAIQYPGAVIPLNTWSHVAITRTSTNITIWVNGVATGYAIGSTLNMEYNGAALSTSIGASSNGTYASNCYLSGLRVVKGSALYSTAFVPPVAPPTAVAGTVLLLNFNAAGIVDAEGIADMEAIGNAQVSTSVVKYNSGSVYFDGNGDWLKLNNSKALLFGTGNFTIEGWVKHTAGATVKQIFSTKATSTSSSATECSLAIRADGGIQWLTVSGAAMVYTDNIGAGVWNHIAVVKNGLITTLYVNGMAVTSASNKTDNLTSVLGNIGAHADGSEPFLGYIEDLRILNYAMYTEAFDVPTDAFV